MKLELVQFLASCPGLGWLSKPATLAPRQESAPEPAPINLTVHREGGNRSSPYLYGIMFEEMDHSGDGGIHGNLLRNNAFQGPGIDGYPGPGLTGYEPLGMVTITQSNVRLSSALPHSLGVSVSSTAHGYVGFANVGYNGVPVTAVPYRCEFWMRGEYTGTVMLRLTGSNSGFVYAERNISVSSRTGRFTHYAASFEGVREAPDGDNEWQVLWDAWRTRGRTLEFGLVQLFPPTYKNRENGLREDIASLVAELKPAFLRFPGGNNIEGLHVDTRWKWNETIGPLINRPGRFSDWFYPNTDALGLDEYLTWCEDMDMTPVLTVWDGKSFGGIISGPDLHPYIDDIMNELEYILGPPNSPWGAVRAQNGRREPYPLQFVEIGNEDDYSGGCDTYPDRLIQIHDRIRSRYRNLTLIANNMEDWCLPVAPIPGLMFDYHYYRKPDQLVAMFDYWDHQPREQPVIIGEYGCRNETAEAGVFWSFMQSSCAEAVHMIGFERNSDVIRMTAYAPLLQHFGFTAWSPTLIGFDSNPGSLTPSTSYYVQRMFSTNRGNVVHRVTSTADFGPVYWVATSFNSTYQVKMANYGDRNSTVNVRIPGTRSGQLEMLSGPPDVSNLPHNVSIVPVVSDVSAVGNVYTVRMVPWAVAVLIAS
ncbi:glycoside hydrolase superfamily [Aspergillus californicus]